MDDACAVFVRHRGAPPRGMVASYPQEGQSLTPRGNPRSPLGGTRTYPWGYDALTPRGETSFHPGGRRAYPQGDGPVPPQALRRRCAENAVGIPETAVLLPAENASVAWKSQLEAIHWIGYLPKWRDIAGYCKLPSETEPRLAECPKNAASGAGETGCPPEPARRPRRRRVRCREP